MKIAALLLLFTLTSCGDSPLLNHSELGNNIGRALQPQTALSFSKFGMPFEITWQNGCPSLAGNCSFDIATAQPMPDGSNVEALIWMPAMGHGSSPFDVKAVGPQLWHFSEVYFIMPGQWQLKLHMKLNDGRMDEVILDYRL